MNVWFTSDPHYFHKNVIRFCKRPFASVDQMNETLIRNWNLCVKSDDKVYVIGDFCFGGTQKKTWVLSQLNGYKILIKGNHDDRTHKMLKAGFQEVHYELLTSIEGLGKVRMSHYPYGSANIFYKLYFWIRGWDRRYLERRPKDTGEFLLHGHVHSVWKRQGRQINVGVDVWGYKPVSIAQLKELMDDQR